MTQKELTSHASVITDSMLDSMYSTISGYMEDVMEFDPYMDNYSEFHDMLFLECVEQIGNLKIEIK